MFTFLTRKNRLTIRQLFGLLILVLTMSSGSLSAGEMSEDEITREIAYMAKKLLDMSGKDAVTIESPAFDKPFIGVCSEITPAGVKLTCVTPGTQAIKAGLQTGDIVTQMNDVSLVAKESSIIKKNYHSLVKNMQTGDKIAMTLLREGETVNVTVTVGALNHPAYVLKVTR